MPDKTPTRGRERGSVRGPVDGGSGEEFRLLDPLRILRVMLITLGVLLALLLVLGLVAWALGRLG